MNVYTITYIGHREYNRYNRALHGYWVSYKDPIGRGETVTTGNFYPVGKTIIEDLPAIISEMQTTSPTNLGRDSIAYYYPNKKYYDEFGEVTATGEAVASLQAQEEAIQKTALEFELAALQREQEQLTAKANFLSSSTATWGSQEAYNAEVGETTEEIQAFNAAIQDLAGSQQEAPEQGTGSQQEAPEQGTGSQQEGSQDKLNPLIPVAALAVAAGAALILAGGKK